MSILHPILKHALMYDSYLSSIVRYHCKCLVCFCGNCVIVYYQHEHIASDISKYLYIILIGVCCATMFVCLLFMNISVHFFMRSHLHLVPFPITFWLLGRVAWESEFLYSSNFIFSVLFPFPFFLLLYFFFHLLLSFRFPSVYSLCLQCIASSQAIALHNFAYFRKFIFDFE